MVVTEYIDGETLAQVKEETKEQTTKKVRLELWHALDLLHDKGLVFGDLRPPNAMITKAHEVKLSDVSWATEKVRRQCWRASCLAPQLAPACAPRGCSSYWLQRKHRAGAQLGCLQAA